MRPDVSVIMPTYDSMPDVTRSLRSVVRQTIGLDRMELLAVDDCSTDGTYEELQRFANEWSGMHVLRMAENSGSGGAPRNLALENASGRYVFMLDSDDALAPDALERMVAYADENDTEIVLPRLEGVGDRGVPQSMFRQSQPRTDVWSSRVNWSLSPMKLFSTALLERAHIRFPEDMKYGSDQPFVTEAYLAAKGISVLADRPYYYLFNRGDRSNLTLLATPERRLITLTRMLELLVEKVDAGWRRDFLLQRQFMIETTQIVETSRQLDTRSRSEALTSLADLTRPHFNESIADALSPFHRVFIELLHRGMHDELHEVFAEKGGARPEVIVDEGRAYELWPFFRDADTGIPDSRYDITRRIRAHAHLSDMAWKGSVLRLSGRAHIDRLESAPSTSLVLRKRDIGTEYVIDTEPLSPSGRDLERGQGALDRGTAGFAAEVDVATSGGGGPLSDGLWDISVRTEHDGLVSEARLGGSHDPDAHSDQRLRLVVTDSDVSVASVYQTARYGNLTLDVGEIGKRIEFAEARAQWSTALPSVLEIAGSVNVLRVPPRSISIQLTGDDGTAYEIAALAREVEGSTAFFATVPVPSAADGQPLPSGEWRLTTQLRAGHIDRTGSVTCAPKVRAVRWWKGPRPMHAKLRRDATGALLRIRPVDMVRAAGRRLGRSSP